MSEELGGEIEENKQNLSLAKRAYAKSLAVKKARRAMDMGVKVTGALTKFFLLLLNPVTLIVVVLLVLGLAITGLFISFGKNENIDNCITNTTITVGSDVPRNPDGKVDTPAAQQQIGNYLMSTPFESFGGKPMTKEQAAGVIGNIMRESGYDNKVSEKDGAGYSNDEIINMGGGYHRAVGLIQWDGVRRTELAEFAKSKGKNWDDFDLQLEFLHHEIDNKSYGETLTKNGWDDSLSARDAAILWEQYYEISADTVGSAGMDIRIKTAEQAMGVLGKKVGSLGSGGCRTGGDYDNTGIVEMALSIALPEGQYSNSYAISNSKGCSGEGWHLGGGYGRNTARERMPAYYEALSSALEGQGDRSFPSYYAGCDRFVGAVIYHTVDPTYPLTGPNEQRKHMESSSNWEYVSQNLNDAQPGDVLVNDASTGNISGGRHILIYIGVEGGKHMIADASNGTCSSARIGVVRKWSGISENPARDSYGVTRTYQVYRFTG